MHLHPISTYRMGLNPVALPRSLSGNCKDPASHNRSESNSPPFAIKSQSVFSQSSFSFNDKLLLCSGLSLKILSNLFKQEKNDVCFDSPFELIGSFS